MKHYYSPSFDKLCTFEQKSLFEQGALESGDAGVICSCDWRARSRPVTSQTDKKPFFLLFHSSNRCRRVSRSNRKGIFARRVLCSVAKKRKSFLWGSLNFEPETSETLQLKLKKTKHLKLKWENIKTTASRSPPRYRCYPEPATRRNPLRSTPTAC